MAQNNMQTIDRVLVIQEDTEFEEVMSGLRGDVNRMVVVEFYATWCQPCEVMLEAYENLSRSYQNVLFLRVDVERLPKTVDGLGIFKLPTYQFYRGSKKQEEFAGASVQKLRDLLKHMASDRAQVH